MHETTLEEVRSDIQIVKDLSDVVDQLFRRGCRGAYNIIGRTFMTESIPHAKYFYICCFEECRFSVP